MNLQNIWTKIYHFIINGYSPGNISGIPIIINAPIFILIFGSLIMGHIEYSILYTFLFGSILLHELGHALTARNMGISTQYITLNIFGGIAAMDSVGKNANQEITIALAGPMVSLVLAFVGSILYTITNIELIHSFGMVNLAIAIFNMLPILPNDGGRVLRALLARKYDFQKATKYALNVAWVTCGVLFIIGIALEAWLIVFVSIILSMLVYRETMLKQTNY